MKSETSIILLLLFSIIALLAIRIVMINHQTFGHFSMNVLEYSNCQDGENIFPTQTKSL